MTLVIWIVALWMTAAPRPAAPPVDFQRDIRPFLDAHCQPCHFTGGKMYAKLPFDRPETVVRLGTKLFTRIKDEKQRAVIRQFLDDRGRERSLDLPLPPNRTCRSPASGSPVGGCHLGL